MAHPWEGFWQILIDDEGEDVVWTDNTSVAVRAQGFWIYTDHHYIEIRADKDRVIPHWPPTDEEKASLFRTYDALGGRYTWEASAEEWVIEHVPTMARDPRIEGVPYRHKLRIDGDMAQCFSPWNEESSDDATTWRRLSGKGSTYLSGAWESESENERWLWLVTASHYGILRSNLERPEIHSEEGEFSDEEAVALFDPFGANAGAHLASTRTFDSWPMVSQVTAYEARKHPTFYYRRKSNDEILIGFQPSDEGTSWIRVG